MWLDYLLDKLITDVKYKNKRSKIHGYSIDILKKIKSTILNFSSAGHLVTSDVANESR